MFRWIIGLLDRMTAVIGAVIFMQFPLYLQQYQSELKGHVAELEWQISLINQAAKLTGKTLNQYISKFLTNVDSDFVHQGDILQRMVERSNNFSNSLFALAKASVWQKPFVFLHTYDYEIARSTIQSFQPGISLTIEALVYAIIGMTIGYMIFKIVVLMIYKTFRIILYIKSKLFRKHAKMI